MFHKFKYLMDILFNKNEYHFNEHVTLMEIIILASLLGIHICFYETNIIYWNISDALLDVIYSIFYYYHIF